MSFRENIFRSDNIFANTHRMQNFKSIINNMADEKTWSDPNGFALPRYEINGSEIRGADASLLNFVLHCLHPEQHKLYGFMKNMLAERIK